MSFSSRRRNYLLTPHRRDGLIEWMKAMLMHSFVLDALETTGADTFSHFEMLIDEHIEKGDRSRLKQLVPTVGVFHTHLPLRKAFQEYNRKHKLTRRKHITISFNEIRHILNLAQVMALAGVKSKQDVTDRNPSDTEESKELEDNDMHFVGPKLTTFDGDQTLYSDGANFESNRPLAHFLYLLLKHGATIAVVTAAGYEYNTERYEYRLSGLLAYFEEMKLPPRDCERFYLFGGECNYLLQMGNDYKLHGVKEAGPGGWMTSTKYLKESPGNWNDDDITKLLDVAEQSLSQTQSDLNMRGSVLRKKRSVGLIPLNMTSLIPREALDEAVLRVQSELGRELQPSLPFCAFNGGRDVWVDVGNKRVGVEILASYTGISTKETLHIGDQFLNTGNDFAARAVCPCIWITSPEETTYILKTILRLANIPAEVEENESSLTPSSSTRKGSIDESAVGTSVNFEEIERRATTVKKMNVFTGELIE